MSVRIKHNFTSSKTDGTDATQVQPSHWNADHAVQMTGPAILGRQAATQGDASEITLGTGLTLAGGVLSATATGGGSAIEVMDEGVSLTTALTRINFTGATVTASAVAGAVNVDVTGGGAGGATNLSVANRTTTTLDVASDTGADATLPVATTSLAGLLSSADKTKLEAITGTNTGDETASTIRTKLGITTLSGSNTGDQVIPTTLPASDVSAWAKAPTKPTYTAAEVGAQPAGTYATGTGSATGVNTGDQTDITGNAGTATALSAGADRTKLDGIATGATANATDAQLRDRATHTGAQAISTITGLQTALDNKAGTLNASTVSSGLMSGADKTKLDGITGTNTGDQTLTTLGVTAQGRTLLTATTQAARRAAIAVKGQYEDVPRLRATSAPDRRARVAYLGDSITDMATMNSGSILDQRGDTITLNGTYAPKGYATYMQMFMNGQFRFAANAGIAGQGIADITGRYDAHVAPFNPDYVVSMMGINDINNLNAATESTYEVAYEAIMALYITFLNKLDSLNVRPIICTIPAAGAGFLNAPIPLRNATIRRWNIFLRTTASIRGYPLIDFERALMDPATGVNMLNAMSADSCHPIAQGASLMALEAKRVLDKLPLAGQPYEYPTLEQGFIINANANQLTTNASGSNGFNINGAGATGYGPSRHQLNQNITSSALSTVISKASHPTLGRPTTRILITSTLNTEGRSRFSATNNMLTINQTWSSGGSLSVQGDQTVVRTRTGDLAGVMYVITTYPLSGTFGTTDAETWTTEVGNSVTSGSFTMRVVNGFYNRMEFVANRPYKNRRGVIIRTPRGDANGVGWLVTDSGSATDASAWSLALSTQFTSGSLGLRTVPVTFNYTKMIAGVNKWNRADAFFTSKGSAAATPVLYIVTRAGYSPCVTGHTIFDNPTTQQSFETNITGPTAFAWPTAVTGVPFEPQTSAVGTQVINGVSNTSRPNRSSARLQAVPQAALTPVPYAPGLNLSAGGYTTSQYIRTPRGDASNVIYAITGLGTFATVDNSENWPAYVDVITPANNTFTNGTVTLTVMPWYNQRLMSRAKVRGITLGTQNVTDLSTRTTSDLLPTAVDHYVSTPSADSLGIIYRVTANGGGTAPNVPLPSVYDEWSKAYYNGNTPEGITFTVGTNPNSVTFAVAKRPGFGVNLFCQSGAWATEAAGGTQARTLAIGDAWTPAGAAGTTSDAGIGFLCVAAGTTTAATAGLDATLTYSSGTTARPYYSTFTSGTATLMVVPAQTTAAAAANTAYTAGALRRVTEALAYTDPTTGQWTPCNYRCTTGGTTGAENPNTWSRVIGATVTSGTAVFVVEAHLMPDPATLSQTSLTSGQGGGYVGSTTEPPAHSWASEALFETPANIPAEGAHCVGAFLDLFVGRGGTAQLDVETMTIETVPF